MHVAISTKTLFIFRNAIKQFKPGTEIYDWIEIYFMVSNDATDELE